MRLVGLLDCNNFFVSCERLFRPDLKFHPTVVLSSNDGCVVARSQEVKDLGIPMGVPQFKIKDEIKQHQIAVFSSNFKLYRDLSKRVMDVLHREVGNVYQYSVDEAFFSFNATNTKEAESFLLTLKQTVEKEIGVPVSLGAAKTMTIAKYASEKEKKRKGISVLVGNDWQAHTSEIMVGEIWGIGGKTSLKMNQLGIKNVTDLLKVDRSRVEKIFGIHGLRLAAELSEKPAHTLSASDELQKSIMSTRSFAQKTSQLNVLEEAVAYHTAHAAEELRDLKAKAKSLRVMLLTSRHGDWMLYGGTLESEFTEPTSDTRVILKEALSLARRIYKPGVPYKKAGVVLGGIVSEAKTQLNLFQSVNKNEDSKAVMETIDRLNQKWGKDTLTIGRTKSTKAFAASATHTSPRYTTAWSELVTVKA